MRASSSLRTSLSVLVMKKRSLRRSNISYKEKEEKWKQSGGRGKTEKEEEEDEK